MQGEALEHPRRFGRGNRMDSSRSIQSRMERVMTEINFSNSTFPSGISERFGLERPAKKKKSGKKKLRQFLKALRRLLK